MNGTEREGFAKLFGKKLVDDKQEAVYKNFRHFEFIWPTVEKICPACRELYSLNKNIKGHEAHPLALYTPKNTTVRRVWCYDCKKDVKGWGKCKDGTHLTSFLIGNNPKMSTLSYILLVLQEPDEKELYTTGFVSRVTDISKVLPPLKYLREELKLVPMLGRKKIERGEGPYIWRKTPKGADAAKEFLDTIYKSWFFGKQLEEFILERKEEVSAQEDVVSRKEKISGTTIRYIKDEARGIVESDEFEQIIMHAKNVRGIKTG